MKKEIMRKIIFSKRNLVIISFDNIIYEGNHIVVYL